MDTYTLSDSYAKIQIREETVFPNNYTIKFIHNNVSRKLRIHEMAKRIVDHIGIVNESRKLYNEGRVISWENFIKDENR